MTPLSSEPTLFAWRFPPSSLIDRVFREELSQAIDDYFRINIGSEDKFATVWEAFKVHG